MNYFEAIQISMKLLERQKKSIFIGQSILYPGNLIYKSLSSIKKNKKLEVPIFEEVQMGLSIGLALNGYLPINCYPRFDFLLLAFNQLINHLDKFSIITKKRFNPKVITRVMVGAKKPIDAGEQHTQDYSKAIKLMVKNIDIYELKTPQAIISSYKKALMSNKSSIMIEYSEKFTI